jgi:hypothetical protein
VTIYEFLLKFADEHWFLSLMALWAICCLAMTPFRLIAIALAVMAKRGEAAAQ